MHAATPTQATARAPRCRAVALGAGLLACLLGAAVATSASAASPSAATPSAASPSAASPGPAASGPSATPALSTIGGLRLAGPGIQVDLPPGVRRPPAIAATGWLVADLDTGAVLASSNAHLRLGPASTLKVLTVITVFPHLDPHATVVAQASDAAMGGTKVGMVPGSVYSVDDLLHGLMLGSGNDTANALARMFGGTPAAAGLLNQKAQQLQALDTHAVNTCGLDAPGQVTSAYDLALFGRVALADPGIARLVATTRYRFPAAGTTSGPKRATFEIQNHNHLLATFPGATGVKNGWTDRALGSFVGSATRGGHSYVVTLLHAKGVTWTMARALLEWAFAAGPRATPVGMLVPPVHGTPAATGEGSPGSGAAPGTTVGRATAALGQRAAAASEVWSAWPFGVAVVAAGVGGGLLLGLRRRRRT